MSETTEMMMDGTLCRQCGAYRGPSPGDPRFEAWQPEGVPKLCRDCKKDFYREKARKKAAKTDVEKCK